MDQAALCRREVVVNLDAGLHLRPISMIANLARQFKGDIRIVKAEQSVDAKNVFDLLTLNAGQGTRLIVEATGPAAETVVDSLAELFATNFPEPAGESPTDTNGATS